MHIRLYYLVIGNLNDLFLYNSLWEKISVRLKSWLTSAHKWKIFTEFWSKKGRRERRKMHTQEKLLTSFIPTHNELADPSWIWNQQHMASKYYRAISLDSYIKLMNWNTKVATLGISQMQQSDHLMTRWIWHTVDCFSVWITATPFL